MNEEKYTLEDFLLEYGSNYSKDHESYIGLDFNYKNRNYRISKEVGDNNRFYLQEVTIIDERKPGYVDNLNFRVLGIYDTIEELLESKKIDCNTIKTILFSEDTIITGQD